MSIAISGANGFIGSNLLRYLHARGYDIVALGRHFGSERLPGIKYLEADLLNLVAITKQGVRTSIDVFIHVAGQAHIAQNATTNELFYKNNVNATKAALEFAYTTGAKKFIFFSSSAVLHESDIYASTKKQAEELVREFCQVKDMVYIIVRPVVVYGEGDSRGNVYKLVSQISRGFFPLVSSGETIKNMIYVQNLCEYISRLLTDREYDNSTLLLRDPETVTMKDICYMIKSRLGRPAVLLPIPNIIWVTLIQVISVLQKVGLLANLNIASLSKMTRHANFDLDPLSERLTKDPLYTVELGINNTVDWVQCSR